MSCFADCCWCVARDRKLYNETFSFSLTADKFISVYCTGLGRKASLPSLYVLKCVTFTDSRIVCAGSNLGLRLQEWTAPSGQDCHASDSEVNRSSLEEDCDTVLGLRRTGEQVASLKRELGVDVSSKETARPGPVPGGREGVVAAFGTVNSTSAVVCRPLGMAVVRPKWLSSPCQLSGNSKGWGSLKPLVRFCIVSSHL